MNRDSRNILIIIIILTVFKGLFSAPLYLLDDEAYYWVWSKNLSLSYFDHPPMIALLIRLSTILFGESAFGIRALGAILTSVSIWLGLDLIYRIYQDRKALWHGLVLYSLAIPFFAAGTIITPDTPMMFFITLALWAFYRAVFESENRYWWISGIAFGLALLSKYTAILWLGSVFLVLVIDPRLRSHLRQPVPWLAGLLAVALFLPVLYWNAAHDWVSFKFQFAHGLQ
ncbi:MAG: glycosyltransferase family 39 protein, partial [Candidatus Marinimicrobia bacterium]|nr:glycosyltransferase family 39 protein [Candidatus Neomarinimicrobiota bacterium]